jgi:hypothetical protein
MKVTTDSKAYSPVTITLESQKELNMLSDALYELELERYNEEAELFLRDVRIELHEFNTHTDSLNKRSS